MKKRLYTVIVNRKTVNILTSAFFFAVLIITVNLIFFSGIAGTTEVSSFSATMENKLEFTGILKKLVEWISSL